MQYMLSEKYTHSVMVKVMIFRKDEALPLPHIIIFYKKERILCQFVGQQNEAHSNYAH